MTARDSSETTDGGEGGSVLTAAAIAQLTGGQLRGDADASVTSVAPLDRAGDGQLTFCGSSRYASLLAVTQASVVLVAPDVADARTTARARVVVDRPQDSLVALLPRLYRLATPRAGIHPTAILGRGVSIGRDVSIGAHVQLGERAVVGDRVALAANVTVGAGARIGDDSRLHSGVVVYDGAEIGRRVIVQSNAVIGSDGFGYVWRGGRHEKIPHVGRCIIEDDVEIGAGTTIDRGSIDDTVIGAGTKIDNLVMIAHNVRVGKLCLVAAQVGLAGSTHIGDGVVIGGQAGLSGHHTVGAGARIAAQSGVFGDIPAGETWSGYPARPHREALKAQAALFRLSRIMKRVELILGGGGRAAGEGSGGAVSTTNRDT